LHEGAKIKTKIPYFSAWDLNYLIPHYLLAVAQPSGIAENKVI